VHLNGHYTHAATTQCRVCGASPQTSLLTDVYGAAVCERCLRRIDADPRQKRQVMLSMSDAIYW
jgi:hypothetical protein